VWLARLIVGVLLAAIGLGTPPPGTEVEAGGGPGRLFWDGSPPPAATPPAAPPIAPPPPQEAAPAPETDEVAPAVEAEEPR
jgi:hypothetical protein